ncbi:MAG: ATP-binding cassette domain-containing protein [Verrucomicrobiota bacterium]
MPETAISLSQVSKAYRNHRAVKSLDLEVPAGSVYGFIGPNGSGKTTTIRMILNIVQPDEGRIEIFGQTHQGPAANDRIGYLPEERGLYRKMTINRLLHYYAGLKGIRPADARAIIEDWLDRMNLSEWRNRKIEALSKGMAQKIQFIAAAINQPRLLILDEPFSGLDPVNKDVIREAIFELKRRGTTLVFSTHDMNTAEDLCDFIFMIFNGCKVLDGTLKSIQETHGRDTIRLHYESRTRPLSGIPGLKVLKTEESMAEIRYDGDSQALLQQLAASGRIHHFETVKPSLHDIFVRIAVEGEKQTA